MTAIRFKDGQILFGPTGAVTGIGFEDACCCPPPCVCNVPYVSVTPCTDCLNTAFTNSKGSARNWLFTLGGTCNAGSMSGCFDSQCPSQVASHTAFFSGTFTLGPCQTNVIYHDCVDLGCKWYDSLAGQNKALVEYNRLTLGTTFFGGAWQASASLDSYVLVVNIATLASDPCTALGNNPGIAAFTYGHNQKQFNFSRTAPILSTYTWDPATCDPGVCSNPTVSRTGCIPSGWSITAGFGSSSTTSCARALDLSGVTCSVDSV